MPSKNQARSGFTLIELMIVVGVIGILASIAYPSYLDYVRKARRVEGQGIMFNIQTLQEKHRVNNISYEATLANLGSFPSADYDFAISGASGTAYTITATAKGGQAGDVGCTSMTLNQASVKTPTSGCWKK
ncbi:MAG: type IV pilin protein [Chromatiaceae bacterium]|nr:type IV pilin protein [Chromatiaceae bacterium]